MGTDCCRCPARRLGAGNRPRSLKSQSPGAGFRRPAILRTSYCFRRAIGGGGGNRTRVRSNEIGHLCRKTVPLGQPCPSTRIRGHTTQMMGHGSADRTQCHTAQVPKKEEEVPGLGAPTAEPVTVPSTRSIAGDASEPLPGGRRGERLRETRERGADCEPVGGQARPCPSGRYADSASEASRRSRNAA